MSEISVYDIVPTPKLADKLIGTSVGGVIEDVTYNFTLQELLQLFIPNIPANTLQGILDYGNTATQDINLTGTINTTDLNVLATANILDSILSGETHVTGELYDGLDSKGTAGQVLTSTGSGVEWYTIPTIIPTLQQVLTSGNTSDKNIILTANITAVTSTAANVVSNTSLAVNGSLKDGTASAGGSNQILSSTGSGVQWVDMPVYNAISPLLYNSSTKTFSIQVANASQSGYLSNADWINFDGKQDAIILTTAGTSGAATFVGNTLNIPVYTPDLSGYVPTSRTLTINGVTYDLSANRSWTIPAGVASVTATAPLSSTGGANPDISISQSSNITDGYLSAADWNIFNNKQDALDTGTGLVKSTAGVISYITDNSSDWNTAYNDSIVSASVTGTATKTLTLNQQDGGTIQASWSDIDTGLTSVGVSMPSAFSVANSPLTSNGTIAITGSGTSLQYIDGTGALQTFPGLTGFVPYTGATTNVNLGEFGITSGYVGFDLTPTATPTGVGTMYWDSAYRTVSLIDGDGDTTLQIGQEERILVHNNTGSTLTDGQVVYVTGSTGNLPSVSLADASSETTSAATLGVVTESIANGADGFITVSGIVNGLNTLAFTEGDLLWLSETAGQFTTVKPISPAHLVLIGYVIKKAGGNGSILVKIQNTQELSESSDVLISAPEIDGQGLFLQTISGVQLWRNRSIVDVLGYTPADEATLISTTAPLSGGGDLSANRTLSISQSGASTDGYLSSIDWNTFNNKQPAGSYVPTSRLLSINGTQYDLSIDRSWNVGTVTSVAALTLGTSGTDLSSSVATSTTTPVITLNVPTASASNRGALSSADWTTFNTKVGSVTASTPLFSSGGSTPNITIQQASGSQNGYLSSVDWTTFNNKQVAGNYITSLTGEATASGPGAAAVTLNNASVTAKVLTGVNITGGTIQSTDSMLTAFGKLQNQINGLIGGSIYQGTWNASTNTPALASSVGTKGYYYIVSVAGTTNLNGITDWNVGDWAIFDGTAWQQVDNTDAVVSVNGQTGAVSLTTDNIPEGSTNLYFTNARSRAALSFAAGSGAYNSTTGVITIPTNTNQLTNGASFITLASLSGSAPIQYNNTTGAISITQAGTASNGYLSSVDWNTFNNKQGALTLTTTGSSGAATLIGNTLNIPNYGTALANYLALTGGTLTGGLYINPTNTATVGLDVASNTVTFRSDNLEGFKRQLTTTMGSGTLVKMQAAGYGGTYVTDLGFYTSSSSAVNTTPNLYLTGGDNRVGINTVTPAYTLDVVGTAGVSGVLTLGSTISNGIYNYTLPSASGTLALTSDIPTGTISGSGTTNYVPKFTSASAIGNSNIQDSGTLITLGSNTTISSGALGIGTTSLTGYSLRVTKNITGATTSIGIHSDGIIQSDVTGAAYLMSTNGATVATAFTLNSLSHYRAFQTTFGAGSTVTNQYGFLIDASLTGATNNYGFYGNIASGTNRWNLYMNGTANNYMAGALGIGSTTLTGYNLRISKNITGATASYAITSDGIVQSDATASASYFFSNASTAASAFTVTNLYHFHTAQGTIGAGSTVTNQIGFFASSQLIGATNNYGFWGNIPSGTNRWNLYMSGTAANYIAGSLGLGTTIPTARLDVFNNVAFSLASLVTAADSRVAIRLKGRDTATNTLAISSNGVLDYALQVVNSDGTASGNIQLNPFGGSVGIGATSLTGYSLRVSKNITGSATSYSTQNDGQIQSDVTSNAHIYRSAPSTQATAFTLSNLNHYTVFPVSVGSGSSITFQRGFWVTSLTGATANYGFVGDIAAASNAWNIYMSGTANNYMAGSLGIGTTSLTNTSLRVSKNITGSNISVGIYQNGIVQSDVTSIAYSYYSSMSTVASEFTVSNLLHFTATQGTLGAGSSASVQTGFYVDNTLIGATNNYGFRGQIASGTNRWNIYMDGTAANYLAGQLLIGTTTTSSYALDVNTGGINGIAEVARFASTGNGAAGRGVGIIISAPGSTNTVSVARLVGYQESTSATANNASFAIQVANSSGTLTEYLRINNVGGVGVGATSINASAKVQIDSTTQGFLPPRMTAAQRTAIATPAEGLVVFQTDGTIGLYLYASAAWHSLTML